MFKHTSAIIMSVVLGLVLISAPLSHSACFSHTQDFDATTGYSYDIGWTSCPLNLPADCYITSATIQLRTKVFAWGGSNKLSVLSSDTTSFSLTQGLVGDLTNITHPNPNTFYTKHSV
jgi:hypothetical protein